MKKLFISDLDGTLLNSDAEISGFTAETVNALIERGMYFTFATARSVYSAKPMTEKLNINAPCVLMNGVSVYDLKNNRYIRNEFIPENISAEIIRVFERHNIRCFMYKIQEDILTAFFTEMTTEVMKQFAEERKRKFRKPFVQCESFTADENIVYFTTTGEYELLLPLKSDIDSIDGADCTFYEDTYTGKWYLEVFSAQASKANALKFLRKEYGFEHITCFGDNLNDISMFREADMCGAVENARPELRAEADFITLSNDNNGVAAWLADNF